MQDKYKNLTKSFEGFRSKPYKCSAGKLTIGYGRNIEDNGITIEEADVLFEHDWATAEAQARVICKNQGLDLIEQRFYVLTDMVFNMGVGRLLTFKRFFSALSKGDYKTAAKEMLDSKWATQVGNRAIKLAALMEG